MSGVTGALLAVEVAHLRQLAACARRIEALEAALRDALGQMESDEQFVEDTRGSGRSLQSIEAAGELPAIIVRTRLLLGVSAEQADPSPAR